MLNASIDGVALHAVGETLSPEELRQRACTELLRQAAQAAGLLAASDAPSVDGVISEEIAREVGLTGQQIEDMYHVMAIANYEDRFVIPSGHREVADDMYEERGGCGFSLGNGCSGGISGANLFGAPVRKKLQTPSEVF